MQPAQIKMPSLHEFDDIPISHQNKDGSYHIVDNHDIPPLIEPYTIFYQVWNIFEFCESFAGLAFGVVYFIRLAMITDPLEVPLPADTRAAFFAVSSSCFDLFINILGGLWMPLGSAKWIKRFLQFICITLVMALCGMIYSVIYDMQPACRWWESDEVIE